MSAFRASLLSRVVAHDGLVIVEDPVGFGAQQFVEDLRETIGEPVVLSDPADERSCLSPEVAVISGPFGAGLGPWRDVVVRRFRSGAATILLLPRGVSGDVLTDEPVPTLLVDGAALLLNIEDVNDEIDVDQSVISLIVELGDGWPAWVMDCLALLDEGVAPGELVRAISMPTFRRRIVGRFLHELEPRQCAALAQLAHFDVFSDAAANAVGGPGFADTVLPYAPGLVRTPAGLLRFCQPVRSELMLAHPLTPDRAEALVPVMVADGRLLGACQTLLDAGLEPQVARLLATVPVSALDGANQRDLIGAFRVLHGHLDQYPNLTLRQARIHRNLGEGAAAIELCEALLDRADLDPHVRTEANIELLLHRHRVIDPVEAKIAIDRLSTEVDSASSLSTRLREVEGFILGQSKDRRVVQLGADRMKEVAAEWELQQERLPAARVLRARASGPLWHLGQYREGQRSLERAAQAAMLQAYDYGITLNLKARFDVRCADLEAFRRSAEQARFTVVGSGVSWMEAFLHWSEAVASALGGSLAGLKRSFRVARHQLGPMLDTDTGVVLFCEIASHAARLGDLEFAQQTFAEVRDRRSESDMEFDVADITIRARSGDMKGAWEVWEKLDASGRLPVDRRWQIELELGLGDLRSGRPRRIDFDSVRSEAERLELTELFGLLAPELSDEIVLTDSGVRVGLFGGLSIVVDGEVVEAPPGKVAELIALLAVEDGQTVIDVVVDELWPDAELKVGQRRLKNVVTKARAVLGQDGVVRKGDTISFGPHVSTDIAAFLESARACDASSRVDQSGARHAAVSALDLYRGALLPTELYSDRISARRGELQRRAVSLVNYLASEHEPKADWLASTMHRVQAPQPEVL